MCDKQNFLGWVIMIQITNDLHSHISFSSSRGAHNHGQTTVHSRAQCLDLGRCVSKQQNTTEIKVSAK